MKNNAREVYHLRKPAGLIALILIMAAVMAAAAGILTEESFADTVPEADTFGQVRFYSTAEPGRVLKDSFRYSDKWFFTDPALENRGLALLSMQYVAAAIEMDPDGLGGDMLRSLGFSGIGVKGNPDTAVTDCNYTYGVRKLSDGSMLVAVAIQSYAFDRNGKVKGWPQNFGVNGDNAEGEHYMLAKAAEAVLPEIAALGDGGDVRYWITGQSRGGALANLIAAKLPERLGSRNRGIYAYTFESPNVVQPKDDADKAAIRDDYSYIHNYVCSDDLVALIPPWGMMRYGTDHMLDTDEANAGLAEELAALGSTQTVPEEYSREKSQKTARNVLGGMLYGIPTREEYSRDHSVTIRLRDGSEQVITYNYQDLLGKVMVIVFDGTLDAADLSLVGDHLSELMPVLNKFVLGYLIENTLLPGNSNMMYWEAANEINAFLKDKMDLDLRLSDAELFALLRLAAPAILDKDAGKDTGYDLDGDGAALPYILPALELPSMLFSHHFDSLIARLHVLAPAPEAGGMAFTADAPEVSDPADRMPRKIREAVSGSECSSWLTADAEWLTDDKVIKNNKVYYLSVDFAAAGHSFSDDQKITLNGEEPVWKETGRKSGLTVMTCVWKFTVGSPKMCTVSFDMNDVGEELAPISVEAGTVLKYADRPADPKVDGYRFDDWQDASRNSWDEVTITGDTYLFAHWILIVDKIDVKFTIPRVGQKAGAPVLASGVPCRIRNTYVMDSGYDYVTTLKNTDPHILVIEVWPDSEDMEFALKEEDDLYAFAGTVSVNGADAETFYESDEGYLRVEYEFRPLALKPSLSRKSVTVKKGKTVKVKITGKDKNQKNKYKNTSIAKVVSGKNASTIKVKGLKKGRTTLKVRVNGTWLKLKVKVK